MNKTKLKIQYIVLFAALLAVFGSKYVGAYELPMALGGLILIAVICTWMGIDYIKTGKRYMGATLLIAVFAVIFMAVQVYLAARG